MVQYGSRYKQRDKQTGSANKSLNRVKNTTNQCNADYNWYSQLRDKLLKNVSLNKLARTGRMALTYFLFISSNYEGKPRTNTKKNTTINFVIVEKTLQMIKSCMHLEIF